MPESSEVSSLVEHYLESCESIYPIAIEKTDIRLAGLIARSALSVILNASDQFEITFVQTVATKWFDRLASLYKDETSTPSDVSRSLKWATSHMIGLFNEGKRRSAEHKSQASNEDEIL